MAGILGGLFDPGQYTGLLGDVQRWQRSPEQAQQAFQEPTSSYQYGGQMVPVFGQPPQQPEVSAQSRIPQQAMQQPQQMQPPVQPQQPGMGDRMRAGFEGFVENAHTGPLGAVLGGVMRATSGSGTNATEKLLMTKGGLDQATARAVMRNPTLMSAIAPQLFGSRDRTDDIKEFEYAKTQGFKGGLQDWMAQKRGGAGEYSLTPVFGTDDKGNTILIQPGKSGTAIQTKLPEGVKISAGVEKIDLGTQWGIFDKKSGSIIGYQPKDIAGAERAKVEGKGQGEASESLKSMQSKMPGLEKVVKELDDLSNKATYTVGGKMIDFATRQAGLEPRESAVARARYTAMVDNQILPLLRDTFGAQFTQKEGESLKATLGDPDLSPQEKQAVLKSFIEQKRRDVEGFKSRLDPNQPAQNGPAGAAAQKAAPAANSIVNGWRFKGGNPADKNNWERAN